MEVRIERMLLCRAQGERKEVFKTLLEFFERPVPDLEAVGEVLAEINADKPDETLRRSLASMLEPHVRKHFGMAPA